MNATSRHFLLIELKLNQSSKYCFFTVFISGEEAQLKSATNYILLINNLCFIDSYYLCNSGTHLKVS